MNYQEGLSLAGSNPGNTPSNTVHSKSANRAASKFARANNSHRAGSRASRAPGISADELNRRFSFQSYSDDSEFELVSTGAAQRALFDKRLLEQLYEQVAMRGGLETKDLRLLAHNSVVTIIGTVSDRAMRTEISNFLRECSPVKTVVNRLKVREDNAYVMSASTQWQRHNMAA
jgi:hypothetical protein